MLEPEKGFLIIMSISPPWLTEPLREHVDMFRREMYANMFDPEKAEAAASQDESTHLVMHDNGTFVLKEIPGYHAALEPVRRQVIAYSPKCPQRSLAEIAAFVAAYAHISGDEIVLAYTDPQADIPCDTVVVPGDSPEEIIHQVEETLSAEQSRHVRDDAGVATSVARLEKALQRLPIQSITRAPQAMVNHEQFRIALAPTDPPRTARELEEIGTALKKACHRADDGEDLLMKTLRGAHGEAARAQHVLQVVPGADTNELLVSIPQHYHLSVHVLAMAAAAQANQQSLEPLIAPQPDGAADSIHNKAQELNHAIRDAMQDKQRPMTNYASRPLYDDWQYQVLWCPLLIGSKLRKETLEVRFSDANRNPDPKALVDITAALANIRQERLILGDERPQFDISVAVNVDPGSDPDQLMREYDAQRQSFKASTILQQVPRDILKQVFHTLPKHTISAVEADGPIHEFHMVFTRALAPERLRDIAQNIAAKCNEADAGDNEGMRRLLTEFGKDAHAYPEYAVTAGQLSGSDREIVLMVPQSFSQTNLVLRDLIAQQSPNR